MRYDKTPLSVDGQVSLLQSRDLTVTDPDRARHYLTHIGYYRLSAYWLTFEQSDTSSDRNHQFRLGSSFEQVLTLYTFNRKLRLLAMEALKRIETAVRSLKVSENGAVMDQLRNNTAEQAMLGNFPKAVVKAMIEPRSAHHDQSTQLLSDEQKMRISSERCKWRI